MTVDDSKYNPRESARNALKLARNRKLASFFLTKILHIFCVIFKCVNIFFKTCYAKIAQIYTGFYIKKKGALQMRDKYGFKFFTYKSLLSNIFLLIIEAKMIFV